MTPRPFTFGDDLGRPAQERRAGDVQAAADRRAAIEAADRDGFARGVAAGRAEATQHSQQRLAEALERVAMGAAVAFEDIDRRTAAIEAEAMAFFGALARKLAGRAIAAQPLAPIEDAAAEAFRHLRGVPHLAVRVHESLVEGVDATLRSMARTRGFDGRVIVIGSDELAPGDAKLDWADGGVVIERAATERAVDAVLAQSAAPFDEHRPDT